MRVQNAGRNIGIPFVGMMWFKTTKPGIVKFVGNAKIGETGTAIIATDARMELASLARIAVKMARIRMINKWAPNKRRCFPNVIALSHNATTQEHKSAKTREKQRQNSIA